MKMTERELNRILQIGRVDVGNRTLFGAAVKKRVDSSHLTLIIGTGGSGIAPICEAVKTIRQKFDTHCVQYVKFITVDSDLGILHRLEIEGIDNVNIFTNKEGRKKLLKSERSEFYKEFVPKEYDLDLLDTGMYSGDRMTAKIKLYNQSSLGTTNDCVLRDKIKNLFVGEWKHHRDLPLDVMILTGIGGGTGSGTFMDIAAIVRKACVGNLAGRLTICGYVLLPDTVDGFAYDDWAKTSIRGNGFAALKELESYWGVLAEPYRKELFSAPSSTYSQTVRNTEELFDNVFLISGDYQRAVSMIAETIVNTVADSGGSFSQASLLSGCVWAKCQRQRTMRDAGILKKDSFPEGSFNYLGLGFAQAAIPEKVVIPNVIGHVCKALYEPDTGIQNIGSLQQRAVFVKGDCRLTRIEFNRAIGMLLNLPYNVSPNENNLWQKVFRELEKSIAVSDNPVELTVRDVEAGQTQQFFAAYQVTKVTNAALNGFVNTALPRFLEELFDNAKKVMKVYGPRAIECLFDGVGNPDERGVPESFKDICFRRQMEVVSEKFAQMANTPGRFPVGLKKFPFDPFKSKALAAFKEDAKEAVIQMVRCNVAHAMIGMQGCWQTEFIAKVEALRDNCEQFARILETMENYYTGVGSSLDKDSYEEFSKVSGGANDINLCQDEKIYRWVRGCVRQKINNVAVGKADIVRAALIDDFYENESLWLSTEKGMARKAFDNCLAKICSLGVYGGASCGMKLGIKDYFSAVLKDIPSDQQMAVIEQKMKEIISRLVVKSKVSLKLKGQGDAATVTKVVLIPRFTGDYGWFIAKFLDTLDGDRIIYYSAFVDSIVCYQSALAIGMSDLDNMDLWEDAYEGSFDSSIHLNNGELCDLHLETGYAQFKELTKTETDLKRGIKSKWSISQEDDLLYGTGLSWEHYPSPNYSRYGNDFEGRDNTREANYRRNVFTPKIELAIKLGLIFEQKMGNIRKWSTYVIPSDWSNLSVQKYDKKDESGYRRGCDLFEYLRDQNPAGSREYIKQIALYDSPAFGPNGYDFTEIIQAEQWTDDRIDRESKLYMKRTLRKMTELYQELEDTLYLFYDIEQELMEKEVSIKKKRCLRIFTELFIKGVVNYDDPKELFAWNIAIGERDGKFVFEDLVIFSRIELVKMDNINRKLFQNDLRLAVVYRILQKTLMIYGRYLRELAPRYFGNLSEKEQNALSNERLKVLKSSYAAYEKIISNSCDKVKVIVETLELGDEEIETVCEVIDFYEGVKRSIEEYS